MTGRSIGGTIQNDMLKEFIAQKTFMCPPKPSLRLITDTVEFGTKEVPRWNTISISGYHIREAGSTAVQELAFTLADGIAYTQAAMDRGLNVDDFAPRFSFFFNSHLDFFEEIAKFRAARRMWAKIMRERFKAKDPAILVAALSHPDGRVFADRAAALQQYRENRAPGSGRGHGRNPVPSHQFPGRSAGHPDRGGCHHSAQNPADHRGGVGVANTIDPLGGSYFVEALTNQMEEEAFAIIQKIDDMGGMLAAIEKNYPQREIADSAYHYQKQIDENKKTVVGVNKYVTEERLPVDILEIDDTLERMQIEKTNRVKNARDNKKVRESLEKLGEACAGNRNVMESHHRRGEGVCDAAGSVRCVSGRPLGSIGIRGSTRRVHGTRRTGHGQSKTKKVDRSPCTVHRKGQEYWFTIHGHQSAVSL